MKRRWLTVVLVAGCIGRGDAPAEDAGAADAGCICKGECRLQRCAQLGRTVVQLADGDAGFPAGIAERGDEIFWLINGPTQRHDGLIMSAPKSGGPAAVLAAGQALPWEMTAAPDGLWWVNSGASATIHGVMHDPLDGGGPRWVGGANGSVSGIAVTDDWVFFSGNGVWRLSKRSIMVPEQIAPVSFAWQLASDATHVYWWGPQFVLSRMAIDGGPIESIVSSTNGARPIEVRDGVAYWSELGVGGEVGEGSVKSMPLDGGTARVLATSVSTGFSVRVDATHVYWVGGGTSDAGYRDAMVTRCPKEGCGACLENLEVLACGQRGSYFLTIDASRVYWTAAGGIWATEK